ncbi:hypothetical protein WL05_02565 [Burkholderia ubonensis]|nr:hypothetical protein WL05_02565 [Burkholderia ubonensis]
MVIDLVAQIRKHLRHSGKSNTDEGLTMPPMILQSLDPCWNVGRRQNDHGTIEEFRAIQVRPLKAPKPIQRTCAIKPQQSHQRGDPYLPVAMFQQQRNIGYKTP